MGTEVLRPQDCLVQGFPVGPPSFHQRKSYFENGIVGIPNPNRKQVNVTRPERLDRRKKLNQPAFTDKIRSPIDDALVQKNVSRNTINNQNPPMETVQVTILRRGQSLDSFDNNKIRGGIRKNLDLENSGCTGGDTYAGSAFSVSPPPNSLPLPSFFNKKLEFESSATRELRRLLGLN